MPPKRPLNVVFLVADELMAQTVGCYGHPYVETPAMDGLAGEGVRFTNTFTAHTKCVPSRACFMTGRYPHLGGHRTLPGFMLRADEPNLASMLKAAGYRTAMFGKNDTVADDARDPSFDEIVDPSLRQDKPIRYGPAQNPKLTDQQFRAFYRGRHDAPHDTFFDAEVARLSADFIARNRTGPFFLLANFIYPHPPYVEVPPWCDRLAATNLEPPRIEPLESCPPVLAHYRRCYDLETLAREDWLRIRRAYLSMTSFVDAQMARVLAALEQAGTAEDTLVVAFSDHGDFAGAHGCVEKWDTFFYEEIVRVPLVMRLPGRLPVAAPDALVELTDLVPTVLDLLGMDRPDWIQGRSLVDLIDGKTDVVHEHVFCQGGLETEAMAKAPDPDSPEAARMRPTYYWTQVVLVRDPRSLARAKMIRTRRHKYVWRLHGEEELFDLVQDPGEFVNVAARPCCREVLADMRQRLIRALVETETNQPPVGRLFA